MNVCYVGVYEIHGFHLTTKEATCLRKNLLKRQPFLHQVDLYLFKGSRRVRKLIRRKRKEMGL